MAEFSQSPDAQDPDAIKKALLAKLFGGPIPGAVPPPGTPQRSLTGTPDPGTPPAPGSPATTQPNVFGGPANSSATATPISTAPANAGPQPAQPLSGARSATTAPAGIARPVSGNGAAIEPGNQSPPNVAPFPNETDWSKQNPLPPHTPYQAPDFKHRLLMGIFGGMQEFGRPGEGAKTIRDYLGNIEKNEDAESNNPATAAAQQHQKYMTAAQGAEVPEHLRALDAQIQNTQAEARERMARASALANPPVKPERNLEQMHAEAMQDALARGVDPATDPKVQQVEDAMQRVQKAAAPKTENDFEQYYTHSLKDTGKPDTAANRLAAHKEWEIKPVQPGAGDARNDSRMDRSYQYNNSALDKVATPVDQAVQRLGRLNDAIAQNTPQADALVGPELLSVMAGGAGSGLRMNEAEISRIVGGRSKWETLKADINQWALDPKKANSITPEQRQQVRALTKTVQDKLNAKQRIIDDARNSLIGANDPTEHRRIVAESKKKLDAIDGGGSESGGGGAATGATAGVDKNNPLGI